MHNVSTTRAGDLNPNVRAAIEQLLGRSIGPDEQVSVIASTQEDERSAGRVQFARSLQEFLSNREQATAELSEKEIDSAIEEAVNNVRQTRE